MFEVGFAELFLLGVIALLVVGPDKLPGLARTVGVWVGRAQRLVGQVRADIEREVRADELRRAAKEYSPTNVLSDMRKEVEDFASDVSKPVDPDTETTGSTKPAAGDGRPAEGEALAASPSVPEPVPGAVAAGEGAATGAEPSPSSAGDEAKTEPAAETPVASSGVGNGADAQEAATGDEETGGSEIPDPPPADAPDDAPVKPSAAGPDPSGGEQPGDASPATPETDEELSNGRTESAAPPPTTESTGTSPVERDERTTAP